MKYMNFIKPFLVMILLFGLSNIYAQKIKVAGKIFDNEKVPLPGATIQIKGTTQGTITDLDGNFVLAGVKTKDTLLISYVGFKQQVLPINGKNNFSVVLEPKSEALNEVVVIGYGEVKKTDVTGSITSVSSADFNKGNITSPEELLAGKASGVVITSNGGAPGSGGTIRIRGGSSLRASNDPLIVVDGIPIDNRGISGMANPLTFINPNDIATFTVLKDASATAIYGARASNGVIIITTKKGSKTEFKASYNASISYGQLTKYLDVYNGDEYRALIKERVDKEGLAAIALTRLGNANTDWQKEIYRNSISQDHNASASGAFKGLPYRLSLGYTDDNGLLKNSEMQRTTLDGSFTPSLLKDKLKLELNIKAMNTANNFTNQGAIGSALTFDPTQPVKNGNTRYGGYTAWTELSSNDPLNGQPTNIAPHNPMALLAFTDNKSKVQRYIGNTKFVYEIPFVEGLKTTLNLGYDYFTSKGHNYTDSLASWSYREPERNVIDYQQSGTNSLLDFYANYVKKLYRIRSKIDFTGGYSWQHYYREGQDSHRPWTMTDGVYKNADTIVYKNEYYLVSFFGRLNYSFADKYYLTATFREDGSSRFSKESRWGLFPSFALSWKINEEDFMKNLTFIDNLKLRLGYGITGQQDISGNYYPYIATYTISQQGAYYQFGDKFYPTLRPNAYDKNIRWEETSTQNIGLDFGFWNDRISGSIDVYKRVTDNLLNETPVAAGTNFSNYLITNVGSMENNGFEANLVLRPISKEHSSLEIGATLSYNQNKITKLTLVDDPSYIGYLTGTISGALDNKVQLNSIGYPANSFYLFQQAYNPDGTPIEGLYVAPDGKASRSVSSSDKNRTIYGRPDPTYLIGLSARYAYKDFDISFSGRLSLGNYVYNNNASSKAIYQNAYNQAGFLNNLPRDVEKTNFYSAQYLSSFYLENASYFRMDNISTGYNFRRIFSDKLSGRISFTVQNTFVITNYSGLDPEVQGGIDNTIYPRPRTYILGFNLNF